MTQIAAQKYGDYGAYPVFLLPVNGLKQHEHVNTQRAGHVLQEMQQTGLIDYPLLIEKHSKIILDGHHRYMALQKLRCNFAPCVLIDLDDANLHLSARRKDIPISKANFIEQVLSAQSLYPEKTTKFTIEPNLSAIDMPLRQLT